MINKYNNIPLYSQLKMLLVEKIENGEYKENSKIPSEQELCEKYKISRPTVRQAISELTNSGYLYKEKGKGTFVSEKKIKIDIKDYTGFSDSILDRQETGNRNIISANTVEFSDDNKLREVFNISNNLNRKIELAEIVYTIASKGEVLSLTISHIPIPLFPDIIDDVNLNKPIHDIFKGKYPLLPVKAKSNLEVVYADDFDGQFLHVQTGQPLIKVENILISKNNQVIEYSISKYRTDKCKLLFENIK